MEIKQVNPEGIAWIRERIKEHTIENNIYDMEYVEEYLQDLHVEGYASQVHHGGEDTGSRRHVWEYIVYKLVAPANDVVYFRVEKEVGRVESYSDGGVTVREVHPQRKIIEVTEYIAVE